MLELGFEHKHLLNQRGFFVLFFTCVNYSPSLHPKFPHEFVFNSNVLWDSRNYEFCKCEISGGYEVKRVFISNKSFLLSKHEVYSSSSFSAI